MRFIRFLDEGGAVCWGVPAGEGTARPLLGDLFGSQQVEQRPVRVVRLLAPVEPPNVLAIGRNYPEHAREMNAGEELNEPLVFLKATTSVIGPDEAIVLPVSAPDEVDYEAELAVVIGRRAKDVSETEAMEYVFGFTCANDVTARDCQKRRDKQWARAKSFDTFCPMGPVLVTRDEVDWASVIVRCEVNGKEMQRGSGGEMIFGIPALVAFLSQQFTLLPGTVILTGTPPGVGVARMPPVFLRSGDRVTVEISTVGRLQNPVVHAQPQSLEEILAQAG